MINRHALRNYNIKVTEWLPDNQFIGTATRFMRYRLDGEWVEGDFTQAVYGWSKTEGRSFMIYLISEGHIQKLATVKREVLFDNVVDALV